MPIAYAKHSPTDPGVCALKTATTDGSSAGGYANVLETYELPNFNSLIASVFNGLPPVRRRA